jgi:hypothetical protein
MKRFLIVPGVLLPPLMILSVVSVFLGQALNWLPNDFGKIETCRLPCWNGIQAGRTPVKEADAILHTLGFELQRPDDAERLPSTTFSYESEGTGGICQVGIGRTQGVIPRVSELTLRFCGTTSLGHIIDLLGEPETILPIVSMVNYQRGEIIVILRTRMCQTAPSPHTPLLFISLTPPVVAPQSSVLEAEQVGEKDSESTNLPWRGFIPVWRYGQLFPGRAVC